MKNIILATLVALTLGTTLVQADCGFKPLAPVGYHYMCVDGQWYLRRD